MTWVEKYRPSTLEQVVGHPLLVKILQTAVATGEMPHLLLYGPAGTGKTSVVHALARQLYLHDRHAPLWTNRVLELNASQERGIDVIRDKVKTFVHVKLVGHQYCRQKEQDSDNTTSNKREFKLVILDEADSMTKDAQAALRRIMETYAYNTRFCILCNYVSHLIAPIQSRCTRFRFAPLASDQMVKKLREITEHEQVTVDHDDTLHFIAQCSNGDMRRAVTLLQTSVGIVDRVVTLKRVQQAAGIIPKAALTPLFQHLFDPTPDDSELVWLDCAHNVSEQAFPFTDLLVHFKERLFRVQDAAIPDRVSSIVNRDANRAAIVLRVCEAEHHVLHSGSSAQLEWLSLLSYVRSLVFAGMSPISAATHTLPH